MFSTLHLFRNITCPKGDECALVNCFFDHKPGTPSLQPGHATAAQTYDPLSAGEPETPAPKRRKLDLADRDTDENKAGHDASKTKAAGASSQANLVMVKKPENALESVKSKLLTTQPLTTTKPNLPVPVQTVAGRAPTARPASIIRPVSPPPKQSTNNAGSRQPPGPPERLIPRPVAKSPVPFKSRLSYIELLFKMVQSLNTKLVKDDPSEKALALLDHQLITFILDDEEKAASATTADLYKNAMSQHYLQFKKMSPADWKKFVIDKIRTKSNPVTSTSTSTPTKPSGLVPLQEVALLRALKTSLVGLEEYGYITTRPSAGDIAKAKAAVTMAHGFEICDRCGTRFQVFPGRNSEGQLTTQGECYHHWARANRSQTMKGARMVGQAESLHACCNKPPGSEGCTRAETHVYKTTDPRRLAAILQFAQTPSRSSDVHRAPVAFDCEMAYTTLGMELVRVTAVSWPDNQELLDVLVRPYGEVLDLNTRFSGVSKDQFMHAPSYKATVAGGENDLSSALVDTKKLLHKVETVAEARTLMFDLLTPDTPLIGHAIENDLNACRMIHPYIIDTILLYPHPAGLPSRYGLKYLAMKYLGRGIQMGGEQGHDSKEDSTATGELVRVKVADKWQSMRLQGWKFEGDRLLAPGQMA